MVGAWTLPALKAWLSAACPRLEDAASLSWENAGCCRAVPRASAEREAWSLAYRPLWMASRSPPSQQLPPCHADGAPDRDRGQRDDESVFPPLALRDVSRAEVDRCGR